MKNLDNHKLPRNTSRLNEKKILKCSHPVDVLGNGNPLPRPLHPRPRTQEECNGIISRVSLCTEEGSSLCMHGLCKKGAETMQIDCEEIKGLEIIPQSSLSLPQLPGGKPCFLFISSSLLCFHLFVANLPFFLFLIFSSIFLKLLLFFFSTFCSFLRLLTPLYFFLHLSLFYTSHSLYFFLFLFLILSLFLYHIFPSFIKFPIEPKLFVNTCFILN